MKPHTRSSNGKLSEGRNAPTLEEQKTQAPAAPYAGKPLDGSQYHDVIDEQIYSEQRPHPEEERPGRGRTSQDRTP